MQLLTIMIVTYNDRAENLTNVLLEPKEFVKYIISHQITQPLKDSTNLVLETIKDRKDVIYSLINYSGVAANRNNALRYVKTGIALCSDDDVTYNKDAFEKIIEAFEKHPNADFITFKILTPNGKDFKKYPNKIVKHNLRTITATGTVEMAFRIDKIKKINLAFDEKFGPGSKIYPLGEDFIFIADAIKKHLKCYFFPISILVHPILSSGDMLDNETIYSRGAVFARTYGKLTYLIDFLFSLKKYPIYNKEIKFIKYLSLMLSGSKSFFEMVKK